MWCLLCFGLWFVSVLLAFCFGVLFLVVVCLFVVIVGFCVGGIYVFCLLCYVITVLLGSVGCVFSLLGVLLGGCLLMDDLLILLVGCWFGFV